MSGHRSDGPPAPDEGQGGYASPACLAHEIDPAYRDTVSGAAPDARLLRRLRALREAGAAGWQARIAAAICGHLHALLAPRMAAAPGMAIVGYRQEGAGDLRPLLSRLAREGAVVLLPDMGGGFCRWQPEDSPTPDGAALPVGVAPAVALISLLGWDDDGRGLEDCGGAGARMLAHLAARPLVVGVALQAARIGAGLAQAGSMGCDVIVTEAGVQVGRDGGA